VTTSHNAAAQSYVDWKQWSVEDFGHYTDLDARYFRAEVGLQAFDRPTKVLELGFGNGAFLAWARDQGAQTYGVESNPFLVDRGRELLGVERAHADLTATAIQAHKGSFTHLVAFDVLEHIEQRDYPALFAGFAQLLRVGGLCVLRYPNGDSPFGRRVQHGDHTHLTTIGSDKLRYFAQRAGFEVIGIRAPALPIRGMGMRRGLKRVVVHAVRFGLETVVGAAYFGKRIALDQNSTAVLRRL
jgi:SAM-dependent methyltransferase